MRVHLVDGTYELFRHYFAMPGQSDEDGQEVAATRGVVASMLALLADGATHVAVATDQVIDSFRNRLWPGYKTSEGVAPELLSQFPLVEEALAALGVTVWPMVEHEADDAMASGARLAAGDRRVEQILLCTPDKDLAQCVEGDRVVQLDRRRGVILDAPAVRAKFGVEPASIPDWLALVGDSADGFPGLPGWGAKSAAAVLARYGHLEAIPEAARDWDVRVRGAARLAATLVERREEAFLFRRLATLVRDAPISLSVDELEWRGPRPELAVVTDRLASPDLLRRAQGLAARR